MENFCIREFPGRAEEKIRVVVEGRPGSGLNAPSRSD
jgi:hypothetical protein